MSQEITATQGRPLRDLNPFEEILSMAFQNQQYNDWLRGLKSQPEQESQPARAPEQQSSIASAVTRATLALLAGIEPQGPVVSGSASNLKDRARPWIKWLKAHCTNPVWIVRQLAARRGDLYLLFAAILLVSVLWRLAGDNTARARGAVRDLKNASQEALIQLGLQSPPSPAKALKPEVRVWVDFQSGVYFCPGTGQYGKTKDGKFTTESNARLSQYQPASHKACN